MSYTALMNAISRAELAGTTFRKVSYVQEDSVDADGVPFVTLKARIDEYLGYEIPKLKGDDGDSIINIEVVDGSDLSVTFESGRVDLFTEVFPDDAYSVGNYTKDVDGNLVETSNVGDRVVSSITPPAANDVTNLEVLETGKVKVSYSDGSSEEIGTIDFYDFDGISSFEIDGDYLYYLTDKGDKKRVDQPDGSPIAVTGDEGRMGNEIIKVEQNRVDYDKIYFKFTFDDGTTIPSDPTSQGIGPAAVDIRLSQHEDVVRHDWDDDLGKLTFYIPEVGELNFEDMHGADADDGADSISLENIEFRSDGTEMYYQIEGMPTEKITGTIKQVVVEAGDTRITNSEINKNNELIFNIGTPKNGTVVVNAGKAKGEDGRYIDSISVEPNGDIKMAVSVKGTVKSKVIGNVDYNKVIDAKLNDSDLVEFTLKDNTTVIAKNSPNGKDGDAGAFVENVTYERDDFNNMSIELTDGTKFPNIGQTTPQKTHSVVREGEDIVFKFDDSTESNIGKLDGEDGLNVTNVSEVGGDLVIILDGMDNTINAGKIPNIQSVEYNHDNSLITFTYDDLSEKTVPYTRPDDGIDGVWLTDLAVESDGRLRAHYSDGTKNFLSGGSVHGQWPIKLQLDRVTDVTDVEYSDIGTLKIQMYGDPTESTLGTLPMVGDDGIKVPNTLTYDIAGNLTIDYHDDTVSSDTVEGIISTWPTNIYNEGDVFKADINIFDDPIDITSIEGFHGVDGRWITNFDINLNRELTVAWEGFTPDDTEVETIGMVDGDNGDWITNINRDGDDLTISMKYDVDQVFSGMNAIDGLLPKWVTAMNLDERGIDLNIEHNDGTTSVVEGVGGENASYPTSIEKVDHKLKIWYNDEDAETLDVIDGKYPTEFIKDDSTNALSVKFSDGTSEPLGTITDGADAEFIVDMQKNVAGGLDFTWYGAGDITTIDDFDGKNATIITSIERDQTGNLVIGYRDKPDDNLGNIDGVDFTNEVTNIELTQDYTIKFSDTNGVEVLSDEVIRQIEDSSYVDDNLTISLTHKEDIPLGDMSGKDVADGIYPTEVKVTNQELVVSYSDPSRVDEVVGAFDRNDVITGQLEDGVDVNFENLVIYYTRDEKQDLGRVKGIGDDGNDIVDGLINNEGQLVLTLSGDRVEKTTERVQGIHGTSIINTKISDVGNLIFVLDDADNTELDVGFVQQDLGFAAYDITREKYDRGESCTEDGNIYVSLEDGVTSRPSPDNSQWAKVRLQDDGSFPDASSPELISPKDEEVHEHNHPFLLGDTLRNYYSVDERLKRIFQVDLADNIFLNPLYEAEENLDGHQVDMELTEGVSYKWRCRDVVLQTGYITDWSKEGRFTVSSNGVPRPIVNIDSSMDSTKMPGMPAFNVSPFIGGTAKNIVWQIKRNSDDKLVYDETLSDLISTVIPFGVVEESTEYSVRAKHAGNSKESAYSAWVPFTTDVKFEINFKPVVSIVTGTAASTTAKPYFEVDSFVNGFYEEFMHSGDLFAEWEVYDSSNTLVWSQSNQFDVLGTQVRQFLKQGKYTIRVRYFSDRFFGKTQWSDPLEFNTEWAIRKPTISTDLDVTDYPVDGLFKSDTFQGTQEEHYGTRWEVRRVDDGSVVHSSYNSFVDLYEWEISFGESDSLQDYNVFVKHLGKYGESDWSDPLAISMQEIIEVSVYVSSLDNSVRRINNLGGTVWLNEDATDQTNAVAVDDLRNAYSVSNDMKVRKMDEFGRVVWTYDHDVITTAVTVDSEYNVIFGDNNGLIVMLDSSGTEVWRYEEHSSKINKLVIDTNNKIYSASNDNTAHKINSDGTNEWKYSGHSSSVLGIDVDVEGNVYTASQDNTVVKMDYRRLEQWTFTGHSNNVNDVSVNSEFNVFTASSDNTTKMINSEGVEQWSYNNGVAVMSVDSDYLNRCYIGGNDAKVRMISSTGQMSWEYDKNGGNITDVTTNEIPVLMKPIRLKGRFWLLAPPENLRAY